MFYSPGIDSVLQHLASIGPLKEYASATGPGWHVRCPCTWNHTNGDLHPSARCWIQGNTLNVWCARGCHWKEWRKAIGLPDSAWRLDNKDSREGPTRRESLIVTEYPYTDEQGELLFTVVRTKTNGHKGFFQHRPIAELEGDCIALGLSAGWYEPAERQIFRDRRAYSYCKTQGQQPPSDQAIYLPVARRVLYDLATLAILPDDQPVVLVEGEKDADNVKQMTGIFATTVPGGAGKTFQAGLLGPLAGRHCFVLCDNDQQGYAHMRLCAGILMEVGARSITTCPWQPSDYMMGGGDISDWLLRLKDGEEEEAFRKRFFCHRCYIQDLPQTKSG